MRLTGIKSDCPRQDMTCTDKNHKDDLSSTQHFPPYRTYQNFAYVGHVVYMWVAQFERADEVSCDSGNTTKPGDQKNSSDHAQAGKSRGK